MTTKELRQIACSAARSHLRECGIEPSKASMREVEGALDAIQRTAPDTYAAQYYAMTNNDMNEWRRFTREWKNGIQ